MWAWIVQSVKRLATGWWGDNISHTLPNRPWGPPNLLYNGYRIFLGGKRLGRGLDHPLPPSGEVNPLTPNDAYSGRTALLTSKRCILYIYSTNIGTEYFKPGLNSPFFSVFKMLFVS